MLGTQYMPRIMEVVGTPSDVYIRSGHENGIFCTPDAASMKMKLHVVTEGFFAWAFHVVLVSLEG